MTTPPLSVVSTETPAPTEWPPSVFHVTAIVEGDDITTHDVRVELSPVAWRELVGDIARALYTQPVRHLLLAAGRPHGDMDREDALTALVARISGPVRPGAAHVLPPVWDISPDAAMHLAWLLHEAADDPVQCACGRPVPQPTELTTTCDVCVTRKGGDGA